MKKLIRHSSFVILLCFSAFNLLAQPFQPIYIFVGTNANDHTGELIGRGTWNTANANWRATAAAISNLWASFMAYTNSQPQNLVKSSSIVIEFATNTYTFAAGSNYLGSYTNVYSFTDNGLNQGTNQLLTNSMSIAGGTWQPYEPTNLIVPTLFTNWYTNFYVTNSVAYLSLIGVTNPAGTNMAWLSFLVTNQVITSAIGTNFVSAPIQLSVLAGIPATGAVTITTLSDWTLMGKYNAAAGQTWDFANATVLNLSPTMPLGIYSPSNAWNEFTATNGMGNGSWRFGLNSNGVGVDINYSNDAPVFYNVPH